MKLYVVFINALNNNWGGYTFTEQIKGYQSTKNKILLNML